MSICKRHCGRVCIKGHLFKHDGSAFVSLRQDFFLSYEYPQISSKEELTRPTSHHVAIVESSYCLVCLSGLKKRNDGFMFCPIKIRENGVELEDVLPVKVSRKKEQFLYSAFLRKELPIIGIFLTLLMEISQNL